MITGYRVGIGGAQVKYGVKPDLTTLGKIIGGGLPIGAFGGRREIMELVAPQGPVYQAGTFSGNPLSLTAGIATLRYLHDHATLYSGLEEKSRALEESIGSTPGMAGGSFVRLGSMFKYFFRDTPPQNYREVKECDTAAFGGFWQRMLAAGVFLPPSQFETNFLSAAHTDQDLATLARAYTTMSIKIGTRGSKLALAQTGTVIKKLTALGISTEKVIITTQGDTSTQVPLHEIGGQGVFVRALDDAILAGEIDCAVHSMKDIPAYRPSGLFTAAILKRDSPADFLAHTCSLSGVRVIGTSSTRRRAQLLRHDPDIRIKDLRGNVDTRIRKMGAGEYDAIVLAEAGLTRLGIRIPGERFPPEKFVPSPNQGTVAVVSRADPSLMEVTLRARPPADQDRCADRACRDGTAGWRVLYAPWYLLPGRPSHRRSALA